jgi:ATP-dependent helicase/nuclease subunit B
VPEQQAAQMERAVLQSIPGRANSRVQVLSFRWLAHRLELAAGQPGGELSPSARQLLVWKLLGQLGLPEMEDQAVRSETAQVLSRLLGDLIECGTDDENLLTRARRLAQPHAQLADKLALLGQITRMVRAHCAAANLHFSTAAARIPGLLTENNWRMLASTRVWIDGFSGFTPAEEAALTALLENCAGVTASLLLDPRRLGGPLSFDTYDWYAPTREQYARWPELARLANVFFDPLVDVTALETPRRWPQTTQLHQLAKDCLQRPSGPQPAEQIVQAIACADERGEVEAAVREVLRLVLPANLGGAGLRYGEISVATRSLSPYADLLQIALERYRIPYFLDQRRSLAHHPICELLRSGLRVGLDQAQPEDFYALLKCDLLTVGGEISRPEVRRRGDLLESYARSVGLTHQEWLAADPWTRQPGWPQLDESGAEEDEHTDLQELNQWRLELLAPVVNLRTSLRGLKEPNLRNVLELTWLHLATDSVQSELRRWTQQAEASGQPELAEMHRGSLEPISALFDNLVAIAGELEVTQQERGHAVAPEQLCQWVEHGLAELSVGFPPPRLDSVLVTDIARGRHHEVAATLLLGLADDRWPPPPKPGAYISDSERALLNGDGDVLLPSAQAAAAMEPYLALVACTRPARYLWMSRPAADSEGRGRAPSPFYSAVLDALGLSEQWAETSPPAVSAEDLVISAALRSNDTQLQAALPLLQDAAPDALRGLQWARSREPLAPLTPELARGLLFHDADQPDLSVRQLEALGECPFQHFARHLLKLTKAEQHSPSPHTYRIYDELMQRTLRRLRESGYDWDTRAAEPVRAAAHEAVEALRLQLGQQPGAAHVLARADWLMTRVADELLDMPAGRRPLLFNASFGINRRFAPLALHAGNTDVRLRGHIGRVDSSAGGGSVVVEQAIRQRDPVSWARFLVGAELELPAAMLALASHGRFAERSEVNDNSEVDAELLHIEPEWKNDAAQFHAIPLSKGGTDGFSNTMLAQTRRILGELAQRALNGEIAPLPLHHGDWTPCARCGMRAVCRFDPLGGHAYRELLGGNADFRKRIAAGEEFIGSATPGGLP